MGEPVEASADIALGEAFGPAAVAHARINPGAYGGTIVPGLIFGAGIVGGTTAGDVLGSWFPNLRDLMVTITGLAGIIAGLFLALRYYAKRQRGGFLKGLRAMGSPDIFPTRFVFDDAGMRTENERMSHDIHWPAVLFVCPGPDHWLVQVDTMTFAIPRRVFADAAAEQAFLDLARKNISDAARVRSVFEKH